MNAPLPSLLLALVLTAATAAPVHAQSLFADPKANRVGDLVTIVLAERTAAQRESGSQSQSGASVSGSGAVDARGLSGQFGADAVFDMENSSRNESVQRDLLSGTITAQVVAVDSAGNLVIAGERRLNVNGYTHLMRVSGKVRPFDIRYDNSLLSYQIANAVIEYRQAGSLVKRWFRPGFWAKVGLAAMLGAAAAYAAAS